ncbi:FKBP-type peptidyl-prolyl cis-trans isomerase, partial [Salmonella enterica subsp. enterica serovar Kentucky]|nr:FKBP-type peptidyl-prolyl cis-trans isomerase [Salmonella enterica subsp. enterica serovar Kentucky]
PGFEDGVKGHKAGEEFTIDVTFPEEYHAENLKGKAAKFVINLSNCIISPGNFAGWRCAYPLYISCSPVGRIRRSRRHPATKLPR